MELIKKEGENLYIDLDKYGIYCIRPQHKHGGYIDHVKYVSSIKEQYNDKPIDFRMYQIDMDTKLFTKFYNFTINNVEYTKLEGEYRAKTHHRPKHFYLQAQRINAPYEIFGSLSASASKKIKEDIEPFISDLLSLYGDEMIKQSQYGYLQGIIDDAEKKQKAAEEFKQEAIRILENGK